MLESSIERIKRDIENIGNISATPGMGRTCFSYSEEDNKVREYLLEQFDFLGLETKIDSVGNIRARLAGSDASAPAVMTGSHIDSVFQGGDYDGIVGVVGALESVRVIKEKNIRLNNPIEIVVFVEEEGSNFGSCCEGSKTMVGKHSLEDLKNLKTDKGMSMYDMAKASGYEADKMADHILLPGEIKAMIEMHIEQSVILENENTPLGIVEAIAGLKQLRVEFTGVPNHAGATPMKLRKDPLVAASLVIAELEDIARNKALPTTVGTVGKIICEPNISNVIPGKVTFTLDIRDVHTEGIDMAFSAIEQRILEIAEQYGLKVQMELLGQQDVVRLSETIVNTIEEVAIEKGFNYMRMNSGAVHDAVLLVPVTQVGMIFVPSKDGRSHVPVEHTDLGDIKLGCDLLLGSLIKLAS